MRVCLAITLGSVLVALLSCRSYTVPSVRFDAAHASWPQGLSIEVTPPVWRNRYPGAGEEVDQEEANRLVADLKATGLFERVWLAGANTASAGLIAGAEPVTRYCFSEPMLTVLTLGAFPNFTCAKLGYALNVSGPALRAPLAINTSQRVVLVEGWLAPVLNLLPSRSASFPREQEVAALRAALQEQLGPVLAGE